MSGPESARILPESPLLGLVRAADARRETGLVPASHRGEAPLLTDFAVLAALVELGATRDRGARLRCGRIAHAAGLAAHDIRPALSRLVVAELVIEIREPLEVEREYLVTDIGAAVIADIAAKSMVAWRRIERARAGEAGS